MAWIYEDEIFGWAGKCNEVPKYPSHAYKEVPEELADRLENAAEELYKIMEECDEYGKESDGLLLS